MHEYKARGQSNQTALSTLATPAPSLRLYVSWFYESVVASPQAFSLLSSILLSTSLLPVVCIILFGFGYLSHQG